MNTGDSSNITPIMAGAVVKSVQAGIITMGTNTTGTATITAVDTSKSILIGNGHKMYRNGSTSANFTTANTTLSFTNSTTVQAKRWGTNALNNWTTFVLIEFESGVTIQKGYEIGTSSDPTTIFNKTISEVDLSRTALILAGEPAMQNVIGAYQLYCYLYNSTTLRIERYSNGAYDTGFELAWQVVSFD